jgi:hypothetical protein
MHFKTEISSANYTDLGLDVNTFSKIKIEAVDLDEITDYEEVTLFTVHATKLHLKPMNDNSLPDCMDWNNEVSYIHELIFNRNPMFDPETPEEDEDKDLYEDILEKVNKNMGVELVEPFCGVHYFDIMILDVVAINPIARKINPEIDIDYIVKLLTRMYSPDIEHANNDGSLVFMSPYPLQYSDNNSDTIHQAKEIASKPQNGFNDDMKSLTSHLHNNGWCFENKAFNHKHKMGTLDYSEDSYTPMMVKYYQFT